MSSATFGQMCGSSSDTPRPILPCCVNLCGVPSSFGTPLMKANRSPLMQRFGAVLAVQLDQLRLVVEQIQLRRRAGHVQIDDPLRLGRKMRRLRGERIGGRRGSLRLGHGGFRRFGRKQPLVRQHRRRRAPMPLAEALKEIPSRDGLQLFETEVHSGCRRSFRHSHYIKDSALQQRRSSPSSRASLRSLCGGRNRRRFRRFRGAVLK